MNIKKGDNVKILSGKDSGKSGKVLRVFPNAGRVLIEQINLFKKHVRPKKQGEKGEVVLIPKSMDVSNVAIVCSSCKKPTRIGYRVNPKNKERICKKCSAKI